MNSESILTPPGYSARLARDSDEHGVTDLIGGVFAEYPGCILDVDGEMPELRGIATYFRNHGGMFWVVERGARIVGCAGFVSSGPGEIELKKLYVLSSERRRGLASSLCDAVEAAGRGRGANRVALWSDTRFLDAHRLYERRGYTRSPATRELFDKSNSVEYHFHKTLDSP